MSKKGKQLNFEGQKIFVGIDVHLKSWEVSVYLEHITQKTFHQAADPDQLAHYLTTHYPGGEYICAYEAGFSGFWIKEALEKCGMKCLVVHPADVPTTDKEKKMKTDKRDSKKIARALRAKVLTPIFSPSKQQQLDRSLVRTKYMLSKDKRRIMVRIKMHLYYYGIKIPGTFSASHWSKNFLDWIELQAKQTKDQALEFLLKELKRLKQLEAACLKEIRNLSRNPRYQERVKLLVSIPGIGVLTAMLLLTELVDIRRFSSLGNLCSYVGMAPKTHSSGEKERQGGLSKRGRGALRSAILEAAWVATRRDPALAQRYNIWAKRLSSGQKAIIKIARKLLNRIRTILLKKVPYEMGMS